MSNLVLQTVGESETGAIVDSLRAQNVYKEQPSCSLCDSEITIIGGFLPDHGKVKPICDSLKCVMEASYAVMKHNGNGSPFIES